MIFSVRYSLPCLLTISLLVKQAQSKNDSNNETELMFSSRPSSSSSVFYSYFLPHEDDKLYMNEENEISKVEVTGIEEDTDTSQIDKLLAKGPLEKRQFVTLGTLPRSGKFVERTYRFSRRLKRDEKMDTVTTENPDDKHGTGDDTFNPKEDLTKNVTDTLKKPPPPYHSSTVIIHYAHKVSPVEKLGDSKAKLGDPCQQRTALEPDICERAAHPNKNKMFCSNVNDTKMPSLKQHTCSCKFYRLTESGTEWKQMKRGVVNINGEEMEICLVPKFGACNHRSATGLTDVHGRPIFEVDICQGHFQCDNTPYYNNLLSGNSTLTVQQHCTEEDFLDQFEVKTRPNILICSKPHPRKFHNYDEFKFYCLPEYARNQKLNDYKPTDSIDVSVRENL